MRSGFVLLIDLSTSQFLSSDSFKNRPNNRSGGVGGGGEAGHRFTVVAKGQAHTLKNYELLQIQKIILRIGLGKNLPAVSYYLRQNRDAILYFREIVAIYM